MIDDTDVVKAIEYAKKARVTIHIRGTDDAPVVEFKDKYSRRVVGGIELKRRLGNV